MIFDLHCDTLSEIRRKREAGEESGFFDTSLSVNESALCEGNYTAQCFAVWTTGVGRECAYDAALDMIDIFNSEIEKSERLARAESLYDLSKNRNDGKILAVLSMENAAPIGNDISRLREFYARGVRMLGLVWNYPNAIGFPNLDKSAPMTEDSALLPNTSDGLTEFGRELVREMNRLGIIVDLSHLSDAGFYDVCEISKKPPVASHSNSRSVCPHVRNLSDGMLKRLAELGGVVGLNFCAAFMDSDLERGSKTLDRLKEHIKHIGNIVGYEHIALGSDFDGIPKGTELESARDMPKLVDGLSSAGFSDSVIEKITYKNALRIFQDNFVF